MQEVTENTIIENQPDVTSIDYTQAMADIHNDLLLIQGDIDSVHSLLLERLSAGSGQADDLAGVENALSEIQVKLSEKLYGEEFIQVSEKLDLITEELVKINEREDKRDEEKKAQDEAALLEAEEAAETTEQTPPETVEPVLDYTENLQLLTDSLKDVNIHLENLLVYQQNMENIQVPMLCGVSLCFGGILAVILSNYLQH